MYGIPENFQCCNTHKTICLRLRPTRFPRGFTCNIVAVVYHPQGSDALSIINHLLNSLSHAESSFCSSDLIVFEGFSRLGIGSLKRHFQLKQLIKSATRGRPKLDLILTNIDEHFSVMQPPFGLPDC